MYREQWRVFIIYSLVILFVCSGVFVPRAYAVDPQFLITWKTNTRVPAWYGGKALPVQNSEVLISLSLIEQNGANAGKLLNLANSEVRWYLKGEMVQKGKGLTSLSVQNRDFAGNYIDLKISVAYSDEAGGSRFIDFYQTIPIVRPEVVIEYRNLLPLFIAGTEVTLEGHPFFFTSASLEPQWNIAGSQKIMDAYEVKISAAPVQIGKIVFSVQNPDKQLEKAEASMVLQAN